MTIKFKEATAAQACILKMNGRFFDGRKVSFCAYRVIDGVLIRIRSSQACSTGRRGINARQRVLTWKTTRRTRENGLTTLRNG